MARIVRIEVEYGRTVRPADYESKSARAAVHLAAEENESLEPVQIDGAFKDLITRVHRAVGLGPIAGATKDDDKKANPTPPASSEEVTANGKADASLGTQDAPEGSSEEELPEKPKRGKGHKDPGKPGRPVGSKNKKKPIAEDTSDTEDTLEGELNGEEVSVGDVRNTLSVKYEEMKKKGKGAEVLAVLKKYNPDAQKYRALEEIVTAMDQVTRATVIQDLKALT